MRCPNCGQRLADEAGRCPVCGTVIDEETRRQAMNEDDFASSSFEDTRQSMGEQASAAQSGRTDQMAPDEKLIFQPSLSLTLPLIFSVWVNLYG